jgi:hypothetical protein
VGRKRARVEDRTEASDPKTALTQPSPAVKVEGGEGDEEDTIKLFVPEQELEQPPTQQSRGWVPPLVDRLLDDSANSQRLRLVVQRRHGYAIETRKPPSRLGGSDVKRTNGSVEAIRN